MKLEWLENWISPGICLLGRAQVKMLRMGGHVANTVLSPSGIWLLAHGNDALLLDAPFSAEQADTILPRLEDFLVQHKLRLKYVTASHLHYDHAASLVRTLDYFPRATFIYPRTWPEHFTTWTMDRIKYGHQPHLDKAWTRTPYETYEQWQRLSLSGESLFLIDAPYHSLTDQLVIFRGVALLPDWHLPEYVGEQLILVEAPPELIRETMTRLRNFRWQERYVAHSRIAVHGDEPLLPDFQERLETAYTRFVERER